MIVGSVVMMFLTDRQLTLIMLVMLVLAAGIIRGVLRYAQPLFTLVQEKLAALNTNVQENLAGIQVVKAFVRERYEIGRFGKTNDSYTEESIKVNRVLAVTLPVLGILTNLGLVAVIWSGGLSVIDGRLSLGELVAFNNYLLIGMAPLLMLGNMLTMVSRAEASAKRILEVLDTKPRIQVAPGAHRADSLEGRVVFSDVSFRYGLGNGEDQGLRLGDKQRNGNGLEGGNRAGGRRVLRGVGFTIKPGQRVALLGATGSGKSTLVSLIPRFYDVTRGRIEIDGVDARQWDPEALRAKIGAVLQQTTLFSGTIRENIAYGRPEAAMDEVVSAARSAQAHEFITAMPDGYDSPVKERGSNLSGGQRQRVAIARALLISPSILILDDSTSAVDMATEAKLQEALERVMTGRTTILVAQRVNTVLSADMILVLDDGRVAAQGTHEELIVSSPIYQEIYYSQLGNGGRPKT
jgi:ATP-binding cassette subfamily B protein